MEQGRRLEREGERFVRGKHLARTCDYGRNVVIASQPLKVQFDRILRLFHTEIPADPGRCVQLRLEQPIRARVARCDHFDDKLGLGSLDRRPDVVGIGDDDVWLQDATAGEPKVDVLQHQEPDPLGCAVEPIASRNVMC
jgi:hypothetical protein